MRRERPHPGAQFQAFDAEGYRHTAFITDQDGDDIATLELRHRRRANAVFVLAIVDPSRLTDVDKEEALRSLDCY